MTREYSPATWDNAEAIWDELWEVPRVGLTKAEIRKECDLTEAQFQSAMRLLKEQFQEDSAAPLVYSPRTHRYWISPTQAEVDHYSLWVIKRLTGQTAAQSRTIAAAKAKFGDTHEVEWLEHHNKGLVLTLQQMRDKLPDEEREAA